MKKIFVMIMLAAAAQFATAQTKTSSASMYNSDQISRDMQRDLELDEAQYIKVRSLNKDKYTRMAEIEAMYQNDPQMRKQKTDALNAEMDAQYQSVLRGEQYNNYLTTQGRGQEVPSTGTTPAEGSEMTADPATTSPDMSGSDVKVKSADSKYKTEGNQMKMETQDTKMKSEGDKMKVETKDGKLKVEGQEEKVKTNDSKYKYEDDKTKIQNSSDNSKLKQTDRKLKVEDKNGKLKVEDDKVKMKSRD
jgi:hypothetical protein